MLIRLITPSNKMPSWVQEGFQTYQERMPKHIQIQICECPLGHRGKKTDLNRAIKAEGEAILSAIAKEDLVIALTIPGKAWSTPKLSQEMEAWLQSGRNVALLIGGPDGLDEACIKRADAQWSLSALTLPHPLVRIILAEQIYRAYTRLINHPYDK